MWFSNIKTGVENYTENLVASMLKHTEKCKFIIFTNQEAELELPTSERIEVVRLKAPIRRIGSEQWAIRGKMSEYNLELLHTPAFSAPIFYRGSQVLTIHDVAFLRYPQAVPKKVSIYMKLFMKLSVKQCSRIVTGSYFSRDEISTLFRKEPKNIEVIYNGVDYDFFNTTRQTELCDKRGNIIQNGYVLSVGSIEPRKNLSVLLEAYSRLSSSIRETHPLLFVGGHIWGSSQFNETIKRLDIDKNVVRLAFVPKALLPRIYQGASVFVYPSLYEGFGLPLIESMASGTPVLCSNVSCIPEIVGDAALKIAPNPDNLFRSLEHILLSHDLVAELREKGLRHAKKYNWDTTALRMLKVYQGVIKDSHGLDNVVI